MRELGTSLGPQSEAEGRSLAFLIKGVRGQRKVAPLAAVKSFFVDVPDSEVRLFQISSPILPALASRSIS